MSNVFWAAFGGAAAAGLFAIVAIIVGEWFRWFIDRPLLKISLSLGYLLGVDDKTWYVFLEASNPHSKPVALSRFGISYKGKEQRYLQVMPQPGYQFPYQLDGGKSLPQWTPVRELLATLKEEGKEPSDMKWVWFSSSSGKLYRSKIKKSTIEALEKEFHKMNES